jgi:hypothetical protein
MNATNNLTLAEFVADFVWAVLEGLCVLIWLMVLLKFNVFGFRDWFYSFTSSIAKFVTITLGL